MKFETPIEMWAIVGSQDIIQGHTLSYWKKTAISTFLEGSFINWKQCRKIGWKAVKVVVTITLADK